MNKTSENSASSIQEFSYVPNFSLKDSKGNLHSTEDFKGKIWILYFYPKDDTPGCTREACDFRDRFKDFKEKNIEIVGISPDSELSHQKFEKEYQLPFLLLSDPNKEVAKLFQVLKEKKGFGKSYLGIERTTFVIDKNLKILKIFNNVKIENHVNDVFEIVKDL